MMDMANARRLTLAARLDCSGGKPPQADTITPIGNINAIAMPAKSK
jgi:hypothetical protein